MLAATSPFFETIFSVDLKEKREESVNLPGIHPDVLRSLVDFLYTGRTTISESTVHHLMAAAHMLKIEELFLECAQYMKAQLNPSNVLTALRIAETYDCVALSEHALVYAGKHWRIVAQGQEFLELSLSHFRQILSSDKFGVDSELDTLKAELLQLVKTHKPAKLRYKIDELALAYGHRVLRILPYHCQYNAVELIWAQVKGYAPCHNTAPPFSTKKMLNLLKQACSKVTKEDWTKVVEKNQKNSLCRF